MESFKIKKESLEGEEDDLLVFALEINYFYTMSPLYILVYLSEDIL